jgi:hypothetical protein
MIAPLAQERPAAPAPLPTRSGAGNAHSRKAALAIAWLGQSVEAAVFRGAARVGGWASSGAVATVSDFEAVLGDMLAALEFKGTDTLLLLEHEQFIHRVESAPSFSEAAARSYLQARVARHERECGEPVWCAQRTVSARQDASFMLHLLPTAFFDHLNQVLASRGLTLSRVYPLIVPLQYEVDAVAGAADEPVLVAAEMSGVTTILVGRSGGRLTFARTIRASWADEPVRVGVEVNRSLLYAKQQLGIVVRKVRLFGADAGVEAVRARCSEGREIAAADPHPLDWLQSIAGLAPHDPLNLVAGHLRRNRRRRLLRAGVAAALWLGLASMAVSAWSDGLARRAGAQSFAALRSREVALRADLDRLTRRREAMERDRKFISEATGLRMPPVPERALGYLAAMLPKSARLAEFKVAWDPSESRWAFHAAGTIEGDEDDAHAALDQVQQQLERSPLRAHFNETPRVLAALPVPPDSPSLFGFNMGGTFFED